MKEKRNGLPARHELKYFINPAELEALRARLRPALALDSHCAGGRPYAIRSLYFDDIDDTAFYDKQAGVMHRDKYRIRIYRHSDREIFLARFTRENVVNTLDRNTTFTMTFRLMFGERPTYVHLKVTRMIEDKGRHVVVGISSVDEQMRAREAFEKAHQDRITYSRVAQALAGDYFSIYVVDPVTDDFFQYSATKEFDSLEVEKEGRDFFNVSRKNMERLIYDGDRERFMAIFKKERIMAILERDGSFTMKYPDTAMMSVSRVKPAIVLKKNDSAVTKGDPNST